jgi:hypothetical protein
MQTGEVERGREQVAPPQAPEGRAFGPCEDAGEEDRRARIVGEIGAAGYLMERARGDSAARQPRIDIVQPNGIDPWRAPTPSISRDARSQIFEDDG